MSETLSAKGVAGPLGLKKKSDQRKYAVAKTTIRPGAEWGYWGGEIFKRNLQGPISLSWF